MKGEKMELCWMYESCMVRSAGCLGYPDKGCYVYRWFEKLISDRSHFLLEELASSLGISFLFDENYNFIVKRDEEDGELKLYQRFADGFEEVFDDRGELCKAFMQLCCVIYPNVENRDSWTADL